MRTITKAKTPAYGYEGGSAIIDALCRGEILEFEDAQGHSLTAKFTYHNWMSRDEIRITNEDNTGCGIVALDPFEWFFEKLKTNGIKLKTELYETH